MKRMSKKQLRGEAAIPSRIIITQIDFLHDTRDNAGYYLRATVHKSDKYTLDRKRKHRARSED